MLPFRTMMRYWPNPAHKLETTEAGPPRWRPGKEPCPAGMTVAERQELLEASIPAGDDPRSRRYAVRRDATGRLEFFEAKWTEDRSGDPVFHGHPTRRVPAAVLRRFVKDGRISRAEYRACLSEFG